MINFVHFSYVPNTAPTNRLLAYMCNIPKDTKVRLFFIMPDKCCSKWEDCPDNVEVIYCWDRYNTNVKLFKFITFQLSINYIKSRLSFGDAVYCYNAPLYIRRLKKKGVKLYGEKTEHPEVTDAASRLIKSNLQKHLSMCRSLDGLFVISKALRDYYINNGVESKKVHIVNMIVDSSRFEHVKKMRKSEKYIAYCGSASNKKDGVDKLIHSFAIVHNKYPDMKLYIIGHFDKNHPNVQLATSLGLLDHIVFTGIISASLVPQLLKNADVLALSRPISLQAQYGFPTKLGEYLLTENPVVITDVGDISTFLVNEESALFASPCDNEDFANKLLWLLDNPKDAKRIGRNGAEVARVHFNAKNETRKLIDLMK